MFGGLLRLRPALRGWKLASTRTVASTATSPTRLEGMETFEKVQERPQPLVGLRPALRGWKLLGDER